MLINNKTYRGLCYAAPCLGTVGGRYSSQCPEICLAVTRSNLLPDPPEGCEFALVSNPTVDAFGYQIWQWTGASWEMQASATGGYVDSTIVDVNYFTTGSWVVTLNGNEVSGDSTYTFDPAADTLDVVFINGNCSYVMDQIVPPSPYIILSFDDIANINIATPEWTQTVADPTSIADWEAVLPGWNLTEVIVDGNTVYLLPDSGNLIIPTGAFFTYNPYITELTDQTGKIVEIQTQGVLACSILTSVTLPGLITLGDQGLAYSGMSTINNTVLETIATAGFEFSNLSDGSGFDNVISVGESAFRATKIANLSLPLITTLPQLCCAEMTLLESLSIPSCTFISPSASYLCPLLNSVSGNLVVTIKQQAFQGCTAFQYPDFPACEEVEALAFADSGYVSADWPALTLFDCSSPGVGVFLNCADFAGFNAPVLANLGNSTGDDEVFGGITGNTINITVPIALQTCNAGAPDGDLVWLAANNTATINYV